MVKRKTICQSCKTSNYLKKKQITNQERCWFCGKRELREENGEYGDWRDLPEKNEEQCEFCNKFFFNLDKHKEKIHGGKEQIKLF